MTNYTESQKQEIEEDPREWMVLDRRERAEILREKLAEIVPDSRVEVEYAPRNDNPNRTYHIPRNGKVHPVTGPLVKVETEEKGWLSTLVPRYVDSVTEAEE